jgi:hypothetical protein
MKNSTKSPLKLFRSLFLSGISLILFPLIFLAFIPAGPGRDFLNQLGISQPDADAKITQSLLGGFLDQQGVQQARHIVAGERTGVTQNLLEYVKKYVNERAFLESYQSMREQNKPEKSYLSTPEEMQRDMIDRLKKSVSDLEESITKADDSVKSIFEGVLVESKKQLKEAENPENEYIAAYRLNYASMLEINERTYQQQIDEWNQKYPENHMHFIRQRLQMFMAETESIDFNAELRDEKGKKKFVNPVYEAKSKRWKMGYRAGKEVVETARNFVSIWITEISEQR